MKVLENTEQAITDKVLSILDKLGNLERGPAATDEGPARSEERTGAGAGGQSTQPVESPQPQEPVQPREEGTEKQCRACLRMLPLSAYEQNWWDKRRLTVRCHECLEIIRTARSRANALIWRQHPATVNQVYFLKKHGHTVLEGLTKGAACDLIAGVKQEEDRLERLKEDQRKEARRATRRTNR